MFKTKQVAFILSFILLFTNLHPFFSHANAVELEKEGRFMLVELESDVQLVDVNRKNYGTYISGSAIYVEKLDENSYSLRDFDQHIILEEGDFKLTDKEIPFVPTPQESESNNKITIVENTPIYDRVDSETILFNMEKGIEITYFQEESTYYEVLVGNRIGILKKEDLNFPQSEDQNELEAKETQIDEQLIEVEEKKEVEEKAVSENKQTVSINATSVFSEEDQYFEVIKENTEVYDNRTGKLVLVGYLQKGEVYPRVSDYGNWHQIKFGDFYGYIRKSDTKQANGSVLKNINKNYSLSDEVITFNADTEVYDNTSGSLVTFAVMPKGLEYPILRHVGSWYLIDVSGRYGYVRKSEVSAEFTESMKYFEVTEDKLDVYDNETGKLIKIGTLVQGQVYPRTEDYGNWHQIKFGDRFGYVRKEGTRPASNLKIWNENTKYKNTNHEIVLTKSTAVYDNSSGKLVPFATIVKGEKHPIISDFGNWWEVDVSGRIGYISKSFATLTFSDDIKYFTVTSDKLPIYDNRGGSLVEVGKLLKDETYTRISDYGNWHQIKFGDYYGYVKKSETEPSIKVNFKNAASRNEKSVGWATTKRSVAVYDNTGAELESFGLINPNEIYPILTKSGKWIKVNYSGRYGFVLRSEMIIHQSFNSDIVDPRQVYSYKEMVADINELKATYPGLIQTKVIGKSVDGRNLYALKLGKGTTEIMINASHHAREYMTTNITMEMIDQYSQAYKKNTKIDGYQVRNILDNASIWFVPMVNPDGVTLVQEGHKSANNPSKVLQINGGNRDFSAWKANIRGVDLNRQYPAGWNSIVSDPGRPAPQNYKGPKPLSEPETKAMYDFTNIHNFKTAVSYHSSGEIIFWNYNTPAKNVNRDKKIAEMIKSKTGYSLVTPKKNPSGGGFTDWFISIHEKPAFTPEISPYVGPKPVPIKSFDSIWAENKTIGIMLAQEAYQNRNTR
ncbi:M14 family metallocarboxypeptidase [Bacillus weihaiensis]|uniref:M14 family metallocarboxypeptidase n=1 Tax=Bacillus weihaiensis TaxID=1547283 RepID=UPI002357128B|nr:M14 family metallocarboxypeptidase [Bacillus weihaiensis]